MGAKKSIPLNGWDWGEAARSLRGGKRTTDRFPWGGAVSPWMTRWGGESGADFLPEKLKREEGRQFCGGSTRVRLFRRRRYPGRGVVLGVT